MVKSISSKLPKFLNIILLGAILSTNVLYPSVVVAQELQNPVEDNSVVLDTSEDILDEGISTNIMEEEAPEYSYTDGVYTVFNVEEKEYVYPGDDNVRVNFTRVTEDGILVIKKVALTEDQRKELNTEDEYGWDISSTMTNGSFTYDLTLPNTQGVDVEIIYSEDGENFEEVANELVNENFVTVKGLDHFTIFVISKLDFATTWDWLHRTNEWTRKYTHPAYSNMTTPSGDVLEEGRAEGLGSDYIQMYRPTRGRAYVGYDGFDSTIANSWGPKLSQTMLEEISWQAYSEKDSNDHYLNIYLVRPYWFWGIRYEYATIVYVPGNTSSDEWNTYSTDLPGDLHVRDDGDINRYRTFADVVTAYSNWYITPDTSVESGVAIVSGSSGGSADLNNYVDNIQFRYTNGVTDTFLFENTEDETGPVPTITTAITSPTKESDIPVTITFDENTYGVELSDFVTQNSTVSDLVKVSQTEYTAILHPIADGNATISLPVDVTYDESGNGNAYAELTVEYDITGPTIAWDEPTHDSIHNESVTLKAHSNETLTNLRFKWKLEGESSWNPGQNIPTQGTTYEYVFDPIEDGRYVLRAQGRDLALNWDRAEDITITVDRTRPTGQIITPEDGLRTNGTITISGWVADTLSGIDRVEVRLRNHPGNTFRTDWQLATVDSSGNYSTTFDTTTIPEDDYEVAVVAYDNAGNNKWLWRRPVITVDRTPTEAPKGMRIYDHKGNNLFCDGYTNNRHIKIDWDDVSATDLDYYILDLKDKDNHKQLTVSEYNAHIRNIDGYYKYKIRTADIAGNISESGKWCGVTLDREAPEGEIKGIKYDKGDVENFITNDNTPILYGTYSDNNGVEMVNIELGGVSYMPQYSGGEWISSDFGPLPDGVHTATLTVTDWAGNETVITKDITVDTSAPIATYTHFKDGIEILEEIAYVQGVNQLTFTGSYIDNDPSSELLQDSYVIFEAQDDGSFRFSANGKKAYCSWRKAPNLLSLSGVTFDQTTEVEFTNCIASLPDGEYYMAHQVYDNATRRDIPSITQFRDVLGLHFVVDTEAPDVNITNPLDGSLVNGIQDLRGTIVEEDLLRYYYRINGTENVASQVVYKDTGFTDMTFYTWDTTMYADGEYDIRLSARDKADNKDTGSLHDITVTVDNTLPEVLAVEDQVIDEGDDLPTDILTTATDINGVVELCYEANNVNFGSTGDVCITPPAPTNSWEINVSDLVIDGISSYLGTTLTKADTSLIPEGVYNFNYYVKDTVGNESVPQSFTVTINNVSPEATLGADTQDILEDETVTFTATFTDPSDIGQATPDDSNWTYTLSYGDGATVQGNFSNPGTFSPFTHTYTTEGEYTARLTVCEDILTTNGEGTCGTSELVITVTAPEVLGAETGPQATGSYIALGTGGGEGVVEEENQEEAEENEEQAEVKGTQSCENPKKLSGYVYVDKNDNGEKDPDEKTFSNVRVTVYAEDNDGNVTFSKELTTDSEGYWETEVCNGDYKVAVNTEDLPKNYSLENGEVIGVSITDSVDEASVDIEVSDERNFWQKNWLWIALIVVGVSMTGYLVFANRREE
jgi:catechol 2,3-dioxygenase-like lactoylglutathione lyase family enzyme